MARPGLCRPRSRNQETQISQLNDLRSYAGSTAYLTRKLRERDLGRDLDGAKITLKEYLDRWLETAVTPRVRAKTWQDYVGILRRYIRPSLDERVLAAMRPWMFKLRIRKSLREGCRLGLSVTHMQC